MQCETFKMLKLHIFYMPLLAVSLLCLLFLFSLPWFCSATKLASICLNKLSDHQCQCLINVITERHSKGGTM